MVTISQERTRLSNVGMRHRRREQWGSTFNYTNARTVTEPATRVFIHITVTNPGNYNSFDAHARAIEAIGRSRFPATGISYNRGFMAGTRAIYEFQPIGRRGAHTVNDFKRSTCSTSGCLGRGSSLTAPSWNLNYNARAYVICQNVGHSVPDHMVEDLARAIVADHRAGFLTRAAVTNIHGHRCVSSKSCPGDRMWARMAAVQSRINILLSGGTTPPPTKEWWEMAIPNAEVNKIADKVVEKLTFNVGKDSTLDALGIFAAGRQLNPASQGAYSWGYSLDNRRTLRTLMARVVALQSAFGEFLEHDSSNPLTKADLEAAIEAGMRKVQIEVSVVEDDTDETD